MLARIAAEHVGSSWTGMEPLYPAQILELWTTKEAPWGFLRESNLAKSEALCWEQSGLVFLDGRRGPQYPEGKFILGGRKEPDQDQEKQSSQEGF